MLDIKLIRENPEAVSALLKKRNCEIDFTELLSWDSARRDLRIKMDQMKNERNVSAKKGPVMKKNGEDVTEELARMKKLSDEITEIERTINEYEEKIQYLMDRLPNTPAEGVVAGGKESLYLANLVI